MVKSLLTLLISLVALPLSAMQMLTDDELGEMTGQAFLRIDRDTAGQTSFTRFTFGMDVDVSLNADLIEFGRYERGDDPINYQPGSSDIRINDFALGMIDDNGNIVPFSIRDPYFELAFDEVNGRQDLVGVRIGFGGAEGKLSGNIEYLTGNLQVEVRGPAGPILEQGRNKYIVWPFSVAGALRAIGIRDDTIMESTEEAVLLHPGTGQPDPIRATGVGLAQGNSLDCVGGCPGLGGVVQYLTVGGAFSAPCTILGIGTCFPLSNFRSLDIGNNGQPAENMFLSFQSRPVGWLDSNGLGTLTVPGAFLNIPNGGIAFDFEESFDGIARIRTKFVDPYFPDRPLPGL